MSRTASPRRGAALEIAYLIGDDTFRLADERLGPRVLDEYELVLVAHGAIAYDADGVSHRAGAGSVILSRPGFHERYRWLPPTTTRFAWMHFAIVAAPADWPEPAAWPIVTDLPDDDLVRPLFRALVARIGRDRAAGPPPRALQRLLETLLTALVTGPLAQGGPDARPAHAALQRALERLRALFADERAPPRVTLADLARGSGATPQHLCRLFRRELALTPMEAVRLMRLDRALTALARTADPVRAIAERCGFASPYHFSRLFHRVYGLPPSRLRARLAAGEPLPASPLPHALHRRGL